MVEGVLYQGGEGFHRIAGGLALRTEKRQVHPAEEAIVGKGKDLASLRRKGGDRCRPKKKAPSRPPMGGKQESKRVRCVHN